MAPSTAASARSAPVLEQTFAGLAGAFLVVALLKYGNPAVLGSRPDWFEPSSTSGGIIERLMGPWPISLGYWSIGLLALMTVPLAAARWNLKWSLPVLLLILPLVWGACQLIAGFGTIAPRLTQPALRHFCSCLAWFYIGVFGFSVVKRPGLLFGLVTIGFACAIASGWYQHWIGLKETREFFYQLPNWKDYPPAFLAKLSSDRIYGPLFYPNAFAGAILLLAPLALGFTWSRTRNWEWSARVFLLALAGVAVAAALYWSQSKAGWLIALVLAAVFFLQLDVRRKWKIICVTVLIGGGLAGFLLRYSGYFSRGATSLSARTDYWRAAVEVARSHPLRGTGPGTFMVNYSKLKEPKAEMARLVHNDYLQQASDSGIPGAAAFALFIWGSLVYLYRQSFVRQSLIPFCVWLGLLGYAIQSFLEFGLYIPALAWPAFFFFGWLLSLRASDTLLAT